MEELIKKMKELLATTFSLYLKAHNFHWNVRGPAFSQYHAFFATLYEAFYDAVDPTAEEIRALGDYAPGGLNAFKEMSRIQDAASGTIPVQDMVFALYHDNQTVIELLTEAHELATAAKQYGLLNFLEAQLDEHKKWAWQLKSSMPAVVVPTTQQEDVAPATTSTPITEEVKTYILNPKQ